MKILTLITGIACSASVTQADTILFLAEDHSDSAIASARTIGGFALPDECAFVLEELREYDGEYYFCLSSDDIQELREL